MMNSTTLRLVTRQCSKASKCNFTLPSVSMTISHTGVCAFTRKSNCVFADTGRSSHTATDHEWSNKHILQQVLELYDDSNSHTKGGKESSNSVLVSDADLDRALQLLQYRLKEARLCVEDCKDCRNAEELQQEVASAESAIQVSVTCLVEFLDALRDAEAHRQERFREIREEAVLSIRDVRSNLNRVKGSKTA